MNFRFFKKYIGFIKITISEILAYPANLISRNFIHAFRILSFSWIYKYLFSTTQTGIVNGVSWKDVVWSMAFVQLIYQCSRSIYRNVSKDVRSGAITTEINKPYSYLESQYVKSLAESFIKLPFFLITTLLVMYAFVGASNLSVIQILWLLLAWILGIFLNILVEYFIAMFSFWIENPDPIYWVLNRGSWFFTGTLVPVAILPYWMQVTAFIYPLSAPFAIGRIFEKDVNYFLYLIILIAWIVIFLIVNNLIFKRATKKLSIHGG